MARTISHTIYGFGAGGAVQTFTIDAGTAFVSLLEGATVVLGPVAATITPGGSATAHTLSYEIPASFDNSGGPYTALWEWEESGIAESSEVAVVIGPALYPSVSSYAARLLRKSGTAVEDSDVELIEATENEVARLLLDYPCLVSYAALETAGGTDLTFFDSAVGMLVASRLRPVLLNGANDGAGTVTEETAGPVRLKYGGTGANAAKSTTPLEDQWTAEAYRLLLKITCIRDSNKRRAANPVSRLARAGARTDVNGCRAGWPYR